MGMIVGDWQFCYISMQIGNKSFNRDIEKIMGNKFKI
jgi:hypothetical protein